METIMFFALIVLYALFGLLLYCYYLLKDVYKQVIDISVDMHMMYSNFKKFEELNSTQHETNYMFLTETYDAVQNFQNLAAGYDELTQDIIKLMFGNPVDQKGGDNEQ